MLKYVLIALSTLSSFAVYADAAEDLSTLLGNFKTFSADFAETVNDQQSQVSQENHGQVYIQRPGKFRWVSEVPTQQVIIANGPTLWTYDIDLEQATKQPFTQSKGVTPANLLSNRIEDLQKKFNVTELTKDDQGVSFRLTPKTPSDLFQSVTMHFNKDQLSEMRVNNNLGQTIDFVFSNIKINPALEAALFQFTPPAGVDVIEN